MTTIVGKHAKLEMLLVLCLLLAALPAHAQQRHVRPFNAQDLRCVGVVGLQDPWEIIGHLASAHILHKDHEQKTFWESEELIRVGAAAQMVLETNPFMLLYIHQRGQHGLDVLVWGNPVLPELAPDLTPALMEKIRDRTPMPNFVDVQFDKKRRDEMAAYDAYCEAVMHANHVPLEAFMKSAAANPDVTFAQMYTQSAMHRGKVIAIKGRLLRLRRWAAPNKLIDAGIKEVYEGWIKGETKNSSPFVVIFPLPADDPHSRTKIIEPAEAMDRPVTFYGYYFKLFRYPIQDRNKTIDRDSPMLIGPTLILDEKAPPKAIVEPVDSTFSSDIVLLLGGFALVVIATLVGLNWWFRRGDRQFRRRLQELHIAQGLEMVENVQQENPPSAPGPELPPDAPDWKTDAKP